MPSAFTWQVRIYYEDTDAGGIVFYANYLKFFERARTEWLRATGVSQQSLADTDGAIFIAKLGRASIEFVQQAWRGDTLLASAQVKVGCVDATTLRPRALPPATAAKMRPA